MWTTGSGCSNLLYKPSMNSYRKELRAGVRGSAPVHQGLEERETEREERTDPAPRSAILEPNESVWKPPLHAVSVHQHQ